MGDDEKDHGFRLIGEGENAFLVRHPNGQEAPIAKAGLSEEQKKEIRSFPSFVDINRLPPTPEARPEMVALRTDAPFYSRDIQVPNPVPQSKHWLPASPAATENSAPVDQSPTVPPHPMVAEPAAVNPAQGFEDAYKMQQKGLNDAAKAESEGAQAQANLANAFQTRMAEAQQMYADKRTALDEQTAALEQSVKNQTIDPNRFWNQQTGIKGGANRVLALVGLFLGGMSQVRTGVNPTQEALRQYINNDIESQKEELNKRQNLLTQHFKKYGNLLDAENATRLDMMNMFNAQLQQAAAQTKSEAVKAQAMVASGQLQAQMAEIKNKLAADTAAKQVQKMLVSGYNIPDEVMATMPQEFQSKHFKIIDEANPNGRWVPARSPEDAKEAMDVQQAANGLSKTLGEMLAFAKSEGSRELTPFTEKARRADTLQKTAIQQYQFLVKAAGGRASPPSEQAMKEASKYIPDPSSLQKNEAIQDIELIMQKVKDIKDQAYANRLLGYNPTTVSLKEKPY